MDREKLITIILKWLKDQGQEGAYADGDPDDLEYVLIDGYFNIPTLADEILKEIKNV